MMPSTRNYCTAEYPRITPGLRVSSSTYLLSPSFCGAGIQAWLSWLVHFTSFVRSSSRCWPGVGSHPKARLGRCVPSRAHVVGRIEFFEGLLDRGPQDLAGRGPQFDTAWVSPAWRVASSMPARENSLLVRQNSGSLVA